MDIYVHRTFAAVADHRVMVAGHLV